MRTRRLAVWWASIPSAFALTACAALLGIGDPSAVSEGDAATADVAEDRDRIDAGPGLDGADAAETGDGGASPEACSGAACGGLVDIAMGMGFACALYGSGQLFCWGTNAHGEVGQPQDARAPTPTLLTTQVDGAALPPFKSMGVGRSFACAIGVDDAVYCWGSSNRGQVGIGLSRPAVSDPPVNVFRPTEVGVAGGPFATIGAGAAHVCVASSAGGVVCWGEDGVGELGYFAPNVRCADDPPGAPSPCVAAPGPPLSGIKFVQLAGGALSTCGVDSQQKVSCWGSNFSGELGRSAGFGGADPPPGTSIEVDARLQFKQVVAGFSSACARTTVGELLCWGDNSLRSLGTQVVDGSAMPIPVHPDPAQGFDAAGGVDDVAIGYWATCALQNGKVYCWGDNTHGQVMQAGHVGPCTPSGFSAAQTGCVEAPTPVFVDADGGQIVRLFSWAWDTCAVIAREGGSSTLCWGDRSVPDVMLPE